MTDDDLWTLLMSITPELRCIRDCQYTAGHTAVIRPDEAAIQAADALLHKLGMPA